MFFQGSLFGQLAPDFDADFTDVERVDLDATTWVDHAPGWLHGADGVFEQLVDRVPLRQRTGVKMFDQVVDEPRLSAWWSICSGDPEPLDILRDVRRALSIHYHEDFDSIGFNLYRDGADSVAWHGDRHRHSVVDPVVAIVSVGARRPLRLRPRTATAAAGERSGARPSRAWELGDGDLFVMGGACQHEWEHTVPKVRRSVGPRLSITFRSR